MLQIHITGSAVLLLLLFMLCSIFQLRLHLDIVELLTQSSALK